jgi:hypothetical protein
MVQTVSAFTPTFKFEKHDHRLSKSSHDLPLLVAKT